MTLAEIRMKIGSFMLAGIMILPHLALVAVVLYTLCLLLFGSGCRTVTDTRPVNTTAQQQDARDAARGITDFPTQPGSRLDPADQARVDHARTALDSCANVLQQTTSAANECRVSYERLSADYKNLQSDYSALQEKWTKYMGLWAQIKRAVSGLWSNVVLGSICIAIGFLLKTFWPLIWGAIKLVLKIP